VAVGNGVDIELFKWFSAWGPHEDVMCGAYIQDKQPSALRQSKKFRMLIII